MILDTITPDDNLKISVVNKVLAEGQQFQSLGLLEYVESPVDLCEIGGLNKLKEWLRVRLDVLGDEAAKFGIPAPRRADARNAGAGKSLSAKAVATAGSGRCFGWTSGRSMTSTSASPSIACGIALRQAE